MPSASAQSSGLIKANTLNNLKPVALNHFPARAVFKLRQQRSNPSAFAIAHKTLPAK